MIRILSHFIKIILVYKSKICIKSQNNKNKINYAINLILKEKVQNGLKVHINMSNIFMIKLKTNNNYYLLEIGTIYKKN